MYNDLVSMHMNTHILSSLILHIFYLLYGFKTSSDPPFLCPKKKKKIHMVKASNDQNFFNILICHVR